ncbi:hypothetical protein AB0I30_29800 [Nocardia tengchongensis]|uniref:hypothetical protein n=1 Tax=Nocardia tengchongensis TaxID=2055889 RepID=UPI0033C0C755
MNGRDIVATGSWLYDDVVLMPVFVVRLDYDFWYEVAQEEDTLEAGEEPFLDSAGYAYYASFKGLRSDAPFWPDSGPHRSADEARIAAELKVPSPITWQSDESRPLRFTDGDASSQ